jgi:Kef-type K+ transport system membrane component KefB
VVLESPVSLQGLFLVMAASTLVVVALGAARRVTMPPVVAEILIGIVIGPSMLGWVHPQDWVIRVLANFGMAYLLFVAGLELDLRVLAHRRFPALLLGYALTLALALGACWALHAAGLVTSPLFVTIALSASALGVLTPVLKERGLLGSEFGQIIFGACVIAEVMPITLLSIFYATDHDTPLQQLGRVMGIAALASLVAAIMAWTAGSRWMNERFPPDERPTTQVRIRQTMLILIGLVVAAHGVGVEVILGALAAGIVVGAVRKRSGMTAAYYGKIEAMGFGLFIPVFFVSVGMCFDLGSLTASGGSLVKVPLYLALLLLARGLPALLAYGRMMTLRQRVAAGLFQATNLSFIAAATATGLRLGKIGAADASALVAAGMLSVVMFPQVAGLTLGRTNATAPLARAGTTA